MSASIPPGGQRRQREYRERRYIEIYNELINDLLDSSRSGLALRTPV